MIEEEGITKYGWIWAASAYFMKVNNYRIPP